MKRVASVWLLLICFNLFAVNPFVKDEYKIFDTPLSSRNTGYKISVSLDTVKHLIKGEEEIFWLNNTEFPTNRLYFHLYMNAFANNQTELMKNTEKLRHGMLGIKLTPETAGYCKVNKITVNFNDLTDNFYIDETVGILNLPFEVQPGESVLIKVEFETKLPKIMIRSGYAGSFHFVAQWFPKLGVFEKNGKWYCEPYEGNGEFYSDFGVYDVEVLLPSHFIATGTGVVINEKIEGDLKKVNFYAEDVHDFVFAAWDKFKIISRKINNKTLYVYYFDEHKEIAEKELDTLTRVFKWYNDNIGEYPYPDYKVVDVPFNAVAASGMEYQTLSTSFSLSSFPDWLRITEGTVIHEFGHAYWQGMVATNENRQAWIDEGLNSFFEGLIMEEFYGKCAEMKFKAFCNDGFSRFMSGEFDILKYEKPDKKASQFVSRKGYGLASYNKFALLLKTIANLEGKDVVIKSAREFFEKFKFSHPDGKDFLDILNKNTSMKYAKLIDKVIYSAGYPDACVLSVEKKCSPYFTGYSKFYNFVEGTGKRECKSYYYRIIVGKRELPAQVEIYVKTTKGREAKFVMSAEENIMKIDFPVGENEAIDYVWVDKDRKIVIDLDRSNNLYKRKPMRFENVVAMFLVNTVMELISYVF